MHAFVQIFDYLLNEIFDAVCLIYMVQRNKTANTAEILFIRYDVIVFPSHANVQPAATVN